MNIGPIRYWEPDDGWRIGSLCRYCHDEFGSAKPHPDDYAYRDCRSDACSGGEIAHKTVIFTRKNSNKVQSESFMVAD